MLQARFINLLMHAYCERIQIELASTTRISVAFEIERSKWYDVDLKKSDATGNSSVFLQNSCRMEARYLPVIVKISQSSPRA